MTSPNRVLTLYGRQDCHLCEKMRIAVEPWSKRMGFDIVICKIDEDAELEARYGQRIPVLADGDQEICHFFFNEASLRGWLAGQSSVDGGTADTS